VRNVKNPRSQRRFIAGHIRIRFPAMSTREQRSGTGRRSWKRAPFWAAVVALVAGAAIPHASVPRPTVILIGLDAFRWDFLARAKTPNLDRLVKTGVRAERLVPAFPTKTFPSFYTVATGLYPEHHGVVANTMYDPLYEAMFRMSDRQAVGDGRWWGGEPIWVTAEKQGQIAATYFFPGTDAPVQGIRPSYWKRYNGSVPNATRVDQILSWLDLPVERRPTLLTLYFSDVDDAAHDYDPDSAFEVAAAIRAVDAAVGLLLTGLEERGLLDQVNIIVVSDHGMAPTSPNRVIFIDDYVDLRKANVIDWTPVLSLRPAPKDIDEVYQALVRAHPRLKVFRKAEIPLRYHYREHRRIAPIIGLADEGWSISSRAYFRRNPERFAGGEHGYDNELPSMGALFVASGPTFERGLVVPPLQSIHLYELMAHILGLDPAPNDGNLDSVRVMLRH
jgi:predicted AlkP superfamily pyrophosphatase or phosphodiesterase